MCHYTEYGEQSGQRDVVCTVRSTVDLAGIV